MVVVFGTALPLAVLRPNPFLFLIAILSFYFALAGWRYATNRRGRPRPLDWISASVMAVAAGAMIVFGVFLLSRRNTNGITMLILGGIGAALSVVDLRTLNQGGAKGRERIARPRRGSRADPASIRFRPQHRVLCRRARVQSGMGAWAIRIRAPRRCLRDAVGRESGLHEHVAVDRSR